MVDSGATHVTLNIVLSEYCTASLLDFRLARERNVFDGAVPLASARVILLSIYVVEDEGIDCGHWKDKGIKSWMC